MPKHKSNCDNMKNSHSSVDKNEDLKLIDVTCPICLSIMIKPVTIPCHHSLCMICFELNVSESNLACPLCRKRISIWVRRMTKAKKLVDEKLWHTIQTRFKAEVDARINGCDDQNNSFMATLPPRKVSAPGEIKEEFEIQLKKLREEDDMVREREEAASREAILALQEEEAKQLNNLIHERETISDQDFEFAKQLRTSQIKETLNSLKSKRSPHVQQKTAAANCSSSISNSHGPLDFFLEQVSPVSRKKIDPQITPPASQRKINTPQKHIDKDDAKSSCVSKFKWKNMQRTYSTEIKIPSADSLSVFTSYPSSPASISSSTSSSRVFKDITYQYSSESEAEFDSEENIPKSNKIKDKKLVKVKNTDEENDFYEESNNKLRKNHSERKTTELNNQTRSPIGEDSQWTFLANEIDENDTTNREKFVKLLEEQKNVEKRLKQEIEDRRFALQLHKSFKKVDRTKGSGDEYCLRKKDEKSITAPQQISQGESTSNMDTPKRKELRQTTLVESLAKKQRRV